MLARLCRNNPTGKKVPIFIRHLLLHTSFRQEEKEKEDVLYECTTKTTRYRILECIGFYILEHRDLGSPLHILQL
jgi:hypothetical protein